MEGMQMLSRDNLKINIKEKRWKYNRIWLMLLNLLGNDGKMLIKIRVWALQAVEVCLKFA